MICGNGITIMEVIRLLKNDKFVIDFRNIGCWSNKCEKGIK